MLMFLLNIQQDLKINKIVPLFTLGSMYSANASGDGQMHETNHLNVKNLTGLRIPNDRRQTSGLFTSMTDDSNSGLP